MTVPIALSIAGSDPSGGAGVQADLKTFSALGAYGTSVITALTAQSTTGVTGVHEVPVDFVRLQLDTLLDDVHVDAVKVGMLGTAEMAHAVGTYLAGPLAGAARVLDPVMVATAGSRLLAGDAVEAVRQLLTVTDLVTPNLAEAAALTGRPVATTVEAMFEQAQALRDEFGAPRVLVKGGHLEGSADAVDVLLDGRERHLFTAKRLSTPNTHGTGCTLSSAIAALRPRHTDWCEATDAAKLWLTAAIAGADELRVGSGHGPVHHFHEQAVQAGRWGRWA